MSVTTLSRIETLNKENYDTWKMHMEALLIKNDEWTYVCGESVKPELVPNDADSEKKVRDWVKSDNKARSDIILSISASELKQVKGCTTSREVWMKLESIYQSKGPARKATLLKCLMLQRMPEDNDVREHIRSFFDAVDKLSEMEVIMDQDMLSIMLLYSLPSSYENFRCAIETRDELPAPDVLKIKIIEESEARKKGACEASSSALFTDWSEGSSVGTLRSASVASPSPEPRLPSYLSLACTVSGYSTTTNYDPIRLARSRDTSPHRLSEHAQDNLTYTVHNNLLSPPNLVPLPIRKVNGAQSDTKNMTEHTMTHHRQEFYRSINTVTVLTTDTKNITSTLLSSDSVDACVENGFRNTSSKCMNLTKTSLAEKTIQEYSNGTATTESKSFIQQRIERLYGPGALAQGFFVMKRQNKNKSFEIERPDKNMSGNDKHSKSFDNQLLDEDLSESNMRQSTSSPALPVLRHLRPEFRAQLPIMVPKKDSKSPMQKSVTVPRLDEVKVNGESVKPVNGSVVNGNASVKEDLKVCDTYKNDESKGSHGVVKDGHYFLKILETEAKRLLSLAEAAEKELNKAALCEEAKGYLRSASGKAKLLVSQKMQQFKGLCTKNITQVAGEAFPTTNEDLQGFWDMVMLQVDQVDMIFKELDSLRANNWKEKIETKNGTTANGIEKPRKVIKTRPVSAAAEQSRKQREAQRKKLIEDKRKAMREQNKQMKQNIEIFVPESSS